jgi:hypothetical protein
VDAKIDANTELNARALVQAADAPPAPGALNNFDARAAQIMSTYREQVAEQVAEQTQSAAPGNSRRQEGAP